MKSFKNNIPNCLTGLRILLTIHLIFISIYDIDFYLIYLLIGLTDVLDGMFARIFNCSSIFGSKFDSFADYVFVITCCLLFYPIVIFSKNIMIWIIIIFIIKSILYIVIYLKSIPFDFFHTTFNRVVGLLLYLFPVFIGFGNYQNYVLLLCIFSSIEVIAELKKICCVYNEKCY